VNTVWHGIRISSHFSFVLPRMLMPQMNIKAETHSSQQGGVSLKRSLAALSSADVPDGILGAIGDTPLVSLRKYLDKGSVRLWAKLESANPGGSAKDRPAAEMIQRAFAAKEITHSTTIIESSSGNMGVGLAQACRYHGLRFICVVDPNAQALNVAIMKALGAEIELVAKPVNGDFLSARLARVRSLAASIPGSYWPNQYANRRNPKSHEFGTIREIDEKLHGDIDYLFVATSSTGTAQGCRDYLRKRGRKTKVVAVDAHGSVLFGGVSGQRKIPGLGAGREPRLAQQQKFDLVRRVSDIECVVGCRRAAHREAMLVGGSAGGVLEVVFAMQRELVGQTCVAILHDSGVRYMDTVFNDAWVEQELGASIEQVSERWQDRPANV